MRSLPKLLVIVFICVTVQRVANFAGGDLLAWLFALGVTIGVFVPAYFLRYKTVKVQAWTTLFFFALCDGLFNLSYTYEAAVKAGRWGDPIHTLATVIFGLFPTFAAGVLGWLSSAVDAIPLTYSQLKARKRSIRAVLKARIIEVVAGDDLLEANGPAIEQKEAKALPAKAGRCSLVCPECGASAGASGKPFATVQALNAHMRKHRPRLPVDAGLTDG